LNQSPNRPKNIKNAFTSYWGIWLILIVLFVFFAIKISDYIPQTSEEIEVAEAMKTPSFGEPEYVGSKRCKDCHWREYDTWRNTLHSKFMQLANEYTVIGDFERNSKLTIKVSNKSPKLAGEEVNSTMFKKDGKFYVNTIGPDLESHDYEITNVIGIGRRQNYLTKFLNGEIHVLPVEWDVMRETWVDLNGLKKNFPGDGEYWSDSESIWQFKCGGCHVTGIEINYDKINNDFDSTWVDQGIGCEACHGPGSNHVKAASEYFDYEKETIINPANLPWRLRAMVCGQCHNWGASVAEVSPSKEGFPKKYRYSYDYLPGKALYLFYIEEPEAKKKHHQQYNEWKTSAHAKAGIMCTTCHNVHQKEDVKIAMTKLTSDSLCMDCHITLQRRAAHRIHTFGSCVACHMPRTIGHEHSHTFQFISPELSMRAGGVDKQPNSCSGCHYHKDTPVEDLVGFLNAAKRRDMPKPFTVHP
jgi:predicted CXXCH cytochrome family protein